MRIGGQIRLLPDQACRVSPRKFVWERQINRQSFLFHAHRLAEGELGSREGAAVCPRVIAVSDYGRRINNREYRGRLGVILPIVIFGDFYFIDAGGGRCISKALRIRGYESGGSATRNDRVWTTRQDPIYPAAPGETQINVIRLCSHGFTQIKRRARCCAISGIRRDGLLRQGV